jgi:leucyl aminopeptidase
MDTMKTDMSGGAVALGVIYVVASLGIDANITALIPATENSIGSKSYKPGDVYTSYSKKTVEVENTDAEGRLILADAISYAVDKIKPKNIVDIATLTGAISIALGEEIAGVFSNNDELFEVMKKASKETGELIWRLPLHEEYKKMLKSRIADIKNVGGRKAGSITAALFLEEFVKGIPWIHIDIGGIAYFSKPRGYYTSLATGFGVRLILDFLEKL